MSNTEGREETSEREEIAPKIKPQYSEGTSSASRSGASCPKAS